MLRPLVVSGVILVLGSQLVIPVAKHLITRNQVARELEVALYEYQMLPRPAFEARLERITRSNGLEPDRPAITIDESYTPTDSDSDGDLDGTFAQGTGRFGIHILGGGTFTGNIFNSGNITVEGNSSAGIAIDSTLAGNISLTNGTIGVIGDNSVGLRAAAVNGNVALTNGTIAVQGANSVGVLLSGDIGGASGGGFKTAPSKSRRGGTRPAARRPRLATFRPGLRLPLQPLPGKRGMRKPGILIVARLVTPAKSGVHRGARFRSRGGMDARFRGHDGRG